MPRLSFALVLVSVAIAVVLWVMATSLESYLSLPEQAPETREVRRGANGQPEMVADTESGAADCQQTENDLVRLVEESRACVTDDDCTLFDYGYPIDCMTSVARSQIPVLREEYSRYDENCEYRVFFDCPTEPYVRLPVCRNNHCVVELDSRGPP